DQAWPLFKHWWDYPYIGGKMALESVPATRADIFAEELSNSKTGWVFDIVYHLHEGRNIHNKNGMGWGIIEPNDMWNIQWVKSITQ
uniref:hypothetical protein n=1 Tax=Alicyclobacillus suci TaxID=2816080 RepID=UPI001A9006E3